MRFSKLEGLGNDFIVVNGRELREESYSDLTKGICDRHYGIGADGLILFEPSPSPDKPHFVMRIFNADGGEAELSGNGLRCLAAHLFYYRIHCADELEIQTLAGVKRVRLTRSSPPEYFFEVQMGEPILDPPHIPFHPVTEPPSLVGCELAVGEEVYSVTITSIGNPHCSIFCDDFASKDLEYLGSRIETHPSFPKRTNVEFIKVKSRREIQVRFWERGVGKTKASGTGSCAAVVASVLNGYTDRGVEVQTLGGCLKVHWRPDNSLALQGPARIICDGDYKGSY
jgi:diaminopimelate epimerase